MLILVLAARRHKAVLLSSNLLVLQAGDHFQRARFIGHYGHYLVTSDVSQLVHVSLNCTTLISYRFVPSPVSTLHNVLILSEMAS